VRDNERGGQLRFTSSFGSGVLAFLVRLMGETFLLTAEIAFVFVFTRTVLRQFAVIG
jgi:hypothetical protein